MERVAHDIRADADDIVRVEGLSKWFGGERIVICGPSGSGKSTLIRCLNRLEQHQAGTVVVDGVKLDDSVKHIEAIRNEIGMVFQHFNLFPHLTVLENCTLAPVLLAR